MKNKRRFPFLIGIFVLLAVIAYLESPYSEINKNYVYFYSNDAVMVNAPDNVSTLGIPILEMQLVNREEINGNIIETYREYEIYKDENGKVIKKIPTSNYDYLKYKEYHE